MTGNDKAARILQILDLLASHDIPSLTIFDILCSEKIDVSLGWIYATLDTMERFGFVAHTFQSGGWERSYRPMKCWKITESGRVAILKLREGKEIVEGFNGRLYQS